MVTYIKEYNKKIKDEGKLVSCCSDNKNQVVCFSTAKGVKSREEALRKIREEASKINW